MTEKTPARIIGLILAGCVTSPAFSQVHDNDHLLIRVTEGQSAEAARLSEAALAPEPVSRLDSEPSVSLSRLGGRGLDPVIRGQGQERVDVLLDGMRVEGACPNRMDPPTSRLSSALPQVLEVRTSNRTLRWGPIAGGQVVATTAAPTFANGNRTTGHLTIGGADNGEGKLVNGSAAVGDRDNYFRLSAGYEEAEDYEDGDGNEVRSAFENTEGRLDGAWTADNGLYVKGMVSRQEERDVKYASGMDAPKTDTDMYRLELGAPLASGGWKLMAWQADVDHVMDNFSLREPPVKMGMPMKMQTLSETRTQGARLVLDQTIDYTKDIAVGVDVESNTWDATMYNGMDLTNEASFLWPDVERDRVGVFAEAFHRIRVNMRLGAGIRYDRVEMDANRADETFTMKPNAMPMSPASIYENVYGVTDTNVTDDNISGFMTGEWRVSPMNTLELIASHSVRSPGVNERYVTKGTAWVGNPDLETEKHHKLELSLAGQNDGWHWRPAVWIDEVDDFVLRYEPAPDVIRYRNIDARLLGVEGELGWSNGTWSATGKLASVRGTNNDTDQPLPQIPPVQYIQTLGWHHMGHTVQAEWMLARRQDRIDEESGLDPGPSPGYGVFSLNGSHPLMDYLTLSWAVDNVFDKTWAPHVSREDLFTGEAYRVNEPGRTFRAALTARW